MTSLNTLIESSANNLEFRCNMIKTIDVKNDFTFSIIFKKNAFFNVFYFWDVFYFFVGNFFNSTKPH